MGKMKFGFVLLVAVVCVVNAQIIEDKDGFCPPVNATANSTNQWSKHECYSDSACIFDHKCCLNDDGIYKCTEPFPTTTTMKPPTEVVKYGECPSPGYHFGRGCNHTYYSSCSRDSDCYGRMKCCAGFVGEDCSVCKYPTFNQSVTTTVSLPPEPTFNPHNFHPGVCPRQFEKFYGYDSPDISCVDHCNGDEDCGEGELCCVEERTYDDHVMYRKRRYVERKRCPVCKKAEFDCRGDYDQVYNHGQVYLPDYSDGCYVCQCFQGESNCYQVCGRSFWTNEWFAAGAAAGVALLLSLTFTLSVCCCLKCCCKDKKQAVVMAPPQMMAQPGNFYYLTPRQEEKLTLTENDHSIA